MTRVSPASTCLCLMTLSACSSAPEVVRGPPTVVEVPKAAEVPEGCRTLRAVVLPPGTTARQVMERQAAVIREYEKQVEECARSDRR